MVGVNREIVGICKLSVEKWNTRLHLKKAENNAVAIHPDTMSNIAGGLSFVITLLYSTLYINTRPEQADCVYQVHKTERNISQLLCVDGLKLLVRE